MSSLRTIDTKAIDKAAEAVRKAWKTPGMAIAVINGDDVYTQGYGIRELGKDDLVTPDTLFAIASTTKAFTTTAIAMLVDEGKMSWDDHPRKYIPFFKLSDPVADANVTLRDLVSHRTGMPRHDGLWYNSTWSREEIVRRYGLAKPSTPFRSTYEYANIPFLAAGLAVGAASGGTWEEFVKTRIFDPLGMTNSNFRGEDAQKNPDHAGPHGKFKGKLIVVPRYNNDRECPAGGINTSANDMSKWMQFHLANGEFRGNRLISEEKILETRKPHIPVPIENPDKYGFDSGTNISSYCLGWGLCDYRGLTVTSHGGCIDGFTTEVWLIPKEKIGIAVFANSTYGPMVNVLPRYIADLIFNLPKRRWISEFKSRAKTQALEAKQKKAEEKQSGKRYARTKPSHELDAYIGEYEEPAYGILKIAKQDGALIATHNKRTVKLKHIHFDTFSGKNDVPEANVSMKITFTLDQNGEVASARFVEPLEVEFKKVV